LLVAGPRERTLYACGAHFYMSVSKHAWGLSLSSFDKKKIGPREVDPLYASVENPPLISMTVFLVILLIM